MDTQTQKFKVRLGLFIAGGLALFVMAIFIIGKQKNLFNPVFQLTTTFSNVSGLQVGNNIRFSGITVGTVDKITIINDSTVKVAMLIKKEVKQFIKSDCEVAIVGLKGYWVFMREDFTEFFSFTFFRCFRFLHLFNLRKLNSELNVWPESAVQNEDR